jgi:hypothetical protein
MITKLQFYKPIKLKAPHLLSTSTMDVFTSILEHCFSVVDYTYVGIGSCPHSPLDKIDAVWDQVLPVFILDILNFTSQTLRIIHFDPAFELEKTTKYFKMKLPSLSLTIADTYWKWSDARVEIIISKEPIYHVNNYDIALRSGDHFLKDLVDIIIKSGGKLVVQEYTGQELGDLRNLIFTMLSPDQKRIFKKKILFDITYGEACHCMTNMAKYKPLYDSYGDYFNFTLYTSDEIRGYIGMSANTDSLIYTHFYKQYASILDTIHLTYRRNIKKADNATDENPDELMAILQAKLRSLFPIFHNLGALTPEKEATLETLFENYREIDMYKWYTLVKDHLPLSVH